MLAALLNVPRHVNGWEIFAQQNWLDHQEIDAALAKQNKVVLAQVIYPIPLGDLDNWLARHQQLHNAESGFLSLQNYDFQSVNLLDARQAEAWIWLHYLAHQGAHDQLKI